MGKATSAYTVKQRIFVSECLERMAPDLVNINYRVPSNLSTDELILNTPDNINQEEWIAACRYVAGTILDHQEQYVEWDKWDVEGVPLYSKTLREVLSNNYPLLRKQMESIGLIRMVKEYSHGSGDDHSKIFVLGEKYSGKGYKHRPIMDDAIKQRIIRWKTEWWADQKKRLSEIFYVIQWLFDGGLEIDKAGAIKAIEDLEAKVIKNAAKVKGKSKREIIIKNVRRRYKYAKDLIHEWEIKVPSKATLDKAGRLYTILSAIPSVLRNFITYKGQQLVAIDIKNSQPMHSIWLLKKDFWDNSKENSHDLGLEKLDNDLFERVRSSFASGDVDREQLFIMLQNRNKYADNQQVNEFTFEELVKSGKLYEFIANRFSGKYPGSNGKRFSDRDRAKKEMMILFYNNNAKTPPDKDCAYNYFKKLFPDITLVMEILKQKNYRYFPVLLQRLEAKMIMNQVCKEAFNKHTEIPLFTIHDCIITTKKHATTLKSIIYKKYMELVGFKIKLKTSELKPYEFHSQASEYIHNKLELEYHEIDDIIPNRRVTKKKPATGRKLKTPSKTGVRPFPNIDNEIKRILKYREVPDNAHSLFPYHLVFPFNTDIGPI